MENLEKATKKHELLLLWAEPFTCFSSVWSTWTGMPTPPKRFTISAVSSMVSGLPWAGLSLVLRPVQYTVAPLITRREKEKLR